MYHISFPSLTCPSSNNFLLLISPSLVHATQSPLLNLHARVRTRYPVAVDKPAFVSTNSVFVLLVAQILWLWWLPSPFLIAHSAGPLDRYMKILFFLSSCSTSINTRLPSISTVRVRLTVRIRVLTRGKIWQSLDSVPFRRWYILVSQHRHKTKLLHKHRGGSFSASGVRRHFCFSYKRYAQIRFGF